MGDHRALGEERTLGTSSLPGNLGTTESVRERLRHITHSVYTGHTYRHGHIHTYMSVKMAQNLH